MHLLNGKLPKFIPELNSKILKWLKIDSLTIYKEQLNIPKYSKYFLGNLNKNLVELASEQHLEEVITILAKNR